MRVALALALTGLILVPRGETRSAPEATPSAQQRVQGAVTRLAAPEWQGRRAGTEGADRAAEWIALEMKAAGLAPGAPDGTFFQAFSFIDGVEIGMDNVLRVTGREPDRSFAAGTDFRVIKITTITPGLAVAYIGLR